MDQPLSHKNELDPLCEVFNDPQNGTPNEITQKGCLALARLGKKTWNDWRSKHPVSQGGLLAPLKNTADFSNVYFQQDINASIDFSGFIFGDGASFADTKFDESTQFYNAQFGNRTNFQQAQFYAGVSFSGARFGNDTNFLKSQFHESAFFTATQFGEKTNFSKAIFCERVKFKGAQFGEGAIFSSTCFKNNAVFNAQTWASIGRYYYDPNEAETWAKKHGLNPDSFQSISFDGADFNGQIDFTGRKFEGRTSFDCISALGKAQEAETTPVKFGRAPLFHNCQLHQDTSFDLAKFPKPSGSYSAARAYRTLKLAFSQQQAIREEQFFFRLEMAEEAKSSSFRKRNIFRTYQLVSDFGFSLSRPALLLMGSLFIFLFIYSYLANLTPCFLWESSCFIEYRIIEFDLLQTFPLPGLDKWSDELRKDLFCDKQAQLSTVIPIIIHKTISFLAWFLIGLALRNLFKLK